MTELTTSRRLLAANSSARPELGRMAGPSLNFSNRHSTKARPLYRTEISHPRRLGVKGADTDSTMGCRIESGETGIQVLDRGQAHTMKGREWLKRQQFTLGNDFSNTTFRQPNPTLHTAERGLGPQGLLAPFRNNKCR